MTITKKDKPEPLSPIEGLKIPKKYTLERTGIWLSVIMSKRASQIQQGWKLHVSARPESLKATVNRVIPILLGMGCDFKIIASPYLLQELNDGRYGLGTVGKAITIYPNQKTVSELAHRLANDLIGFEAPQINSDRRLRPDAPVYYRYGPFSPRLQMNDQGHVDIMLKAPNGRMTSGLAGDTYSAPDWSYDPLSNTRLRGAILPRKNGAIVIGEHYRIVAAFKRTYRGTSYRGIDMRSGHQVIVKEARAFVNETIECDARAYIRNERRVLDRLKGISGIPRVVDHFAYGNDEFLVTTDLGSSNLREDILNFGVYGWDPSSQRNVLDLAHAILGIIDDVHHHGVIHRDLAPNNIVRMEDGQWGLVDFELSSFEGIQRYGWSPGYSKERQRRNESAKIEDDYYSLGATLFHAMTGLDPVIIDQKHDTNISRTISCLTAVCGTNAPIVTIISNLLDSDEKAQYKAVRKLRRTSFFEISAHHRMVRKSLPLIPIFHHTLDAILEFTKKIAACDVTKSTIPPPVVAYEGTAGIVMELAQHTRTLAAASQLAKITAFISERVDIPSALLYGRMGISLALQTVANATADAQLHHAAEQIIPGKEDVAKEQRVDITHGLAGLGIGYLSFAAVASNPDPYRKLADQCATQLLAGKELIDKQLGVLPVGNVVHGISIKDGFAHGRAGIAYFLLAHGAESFHKDSLTQAYEMIDELASLVPELASRAKTHTARPMAASWCQGLAGIGTTLVRGARFFDDERFLGAAQEAATACLAVAPRVGLVTQCCGLSGIGEFLLDLSNVADRNRYRREALNILSLILMRSGGSPRAPSFPDKSLVEISPSWAAGASGVLSFLRRLVDPSSSRLWMADGVLFKPIR